MLRSLFALVGSLYLAACVSDSPGVTATAQGNLLVNGGFELSGCAGWVANSAILKDEPSAHNGTRACRVCSDSNPDTSVYAVFQSVAVMKLKVDSVYQASAWVRAPGDGPVSKELHVALAIQDVDGNTLAGENENTDEGLTNDYHELKAPSLVYKAMDKAAKIDFAVINRNTDHACFVIDDASITAP